MEEREKNIAFFDSGIGGMNVLRDALKTLPVENYIYFADTDNVPYGIKSHLEVKEFIGKAVEYLYGMNIKLLVVACNTATSLAIKHLREKYSFPIIGMEPAVKPAIENSSQKRVLVAATTLTLKEEKLENLLKELDINGIADKIALDGLVRFAEDRNFTGNEPAVYLKEKFRHFDFKDYDAVVLGCTHFNYYENMIRDIIGIDDVKIIDGNEGTVKRLKSILVDNGLLNNNGSGIITYVNSCRIVSSEKEILNYNSLLTV